ncbi:MAG: hypothetical protein ABIK28_18810 [Planctomycetota bacterium]
MPGEDGLKAFSEECKNLSIDLIPLIVRTAKWVHPETFKLLPAWYPEFSRRAKRYDAKWRTITINKKRGEEKHEGNERAQAALKKALGIRDEKDWPNWTCCHIWGVDDPKFQLRNSIVRDPKYYSCVANMVLLPTPIKALTDSVSEVKTMLRICAWNLYGWVCDHDDVSSEAEKVKAGFIPEGYPPEWPRGSKDRPPPGTVGLSDYIKVAAARRLTKIRADLADSSLTHYPRASVLETLKYWKIPHKLGN